MELPVKKYSLTKEELNKLGLIWGKFQEYQLLTEVFQEKFDKIIFKEVLPRIGFKTDTTKRVNVHVDFDKGIVEITEIVLPTNTDILKIKKTDVQGKEKRPM